MPDERSTNHTEPEGCAKRKPYTVPTVVLLGRLDDLTLGTTGSACDGIAPANLAEGGTLPPCIP